MRPWRQEATVHWTDTTTLKIAAITGALALGCCATQDTILPPSERQMADIYREAMDEFAGQFSAGMGAEAVRELLADIELDELAGTLRLEMK